LTSQTESLDPEHNKGLDQATVISSSLTKETASNVPEKRSGRPSCCFLVKLPCRACCNQEFVEEDQQKEHEKLCSLKLSPTKCWICGFCHRKFASYAHTSAVQHASRCFLNPEAQKASATIRRSLADKESEGRNNSSKRSRSITESLTSEAPICDCAVNPGLTIICVSHSEKNPGRRYFRCRKVKVEDCCRFFKWAD
jgi:hypothetical protein